MPTYGKQLGGGGGGAGTVTTDSTLTGDGSGGSPLGVNPTAARAPDWYSYCRVLFQQKTGVSPIDIQSYPDTFGQVIGGSAVPTAHGFSTGAPGAVARSITYPGGFLMTGPSSGSAGVAFAEWSQDQGTSNNMFCNPRTRRWGAFFRAAVTAAPAAASQVSLGIRAGSSWLGIGYVGAAANWQYVRGGAGAQAAITTGSTAIDSTGNKFVTVYVGNFDLTNVVFNADVRAGASDVVGEVVGSIPASTGCGAVLLGGIVADGLVLHNTLICCEMPITGV